MKPYRQARGDVASPVSRSCLSLPAKNSAYTAPASFQMFLGVVRGRPDHGATTMKQLSSGTFTASLLALSLTGCAGSARPAAQPAPSGPPPAGANPATRAPDAGPVDAPQAAATATSRQTRTDRAR